MTSKKSSQAQPAWPTTRPNTAGDRVSDLDDGGPSVADALRRDDLVITCPPWPPAEMSIRESLEPLLASGDWARYGGEILEQLKQQIRQWVGCDHVRLTCSGSAAIELALRAIPLRPAADGSPAEVICPVLDYPGNARAVRLVGALPVLVDTLPGRWTIDPAMVQQAASARTAAVIATHLYGDVAEAAALRTLCDERGWTLIEDVCQAPGASLEGRPAGSLGHVAAWSFGGAKPLTAGCGGALTTDDPRLAQRLASHCDRPSDAYPLSPLQAAVASPQWSQVDQLAVKQQRALERLTQLLAEAGAPWHWPEPAVAGRRPVFFKLPIQLIGADPAVSQRRDALVEAARRRGLPAGLPFRLPGRLVPSRGRVDSSRQATEMVATGWLLDHRVLAGDLRWLATLADCLRQLASESVVTAPATSTTRR